MKDNTSNGKWEEIRDASAKPTRRYELDWLRVLVILNLVPIHATWLITYVPEFSHTSQEGVGVTIIKYYVSFVAYWHMPLLFFLVGTTTFMSLSYRSPREYVLERAKRLVVPLIFFVLILWPLALYFFPGSSDGRSLSDYLFRFWLKCLKAPHICQYVGRPAQPGWGHLWFVSYLLVISLVTLPLLIYCKKHLRRGLAHHWITLTSKSGGIFLPGILFVIVLVTLTPIWPLFYQHNLYQDWAYFSYHLVAFILGFAFCLDDRFQEAIDRHLRLSLPLAIVSSVIILVMRYSMPGFSTPAYHPRYLLYTTIFGFQTWFWILALLGLARRFLSRSNRFLAYFSRASYPFYILHLTLMVPIGHNVVQWRLGVFGESVLLCILSFVATIAVYELVRRTNVTRFLFGMKA
ncbi:MAG: acyltransferase family protein [Planctomycetota bacterium]|jgi:peptidoglycan/LPS O-acetylase OafA/YrhL